MSTTSNSRRGSVLLLAAGATIASVCAFPASAGDDPYAHLPSTLDLTAVIRDFKAKEQQGGHKDFQAYSGSTTVGLVEDTLGRDGKPVPKSLRGMKISSQYKNKAGKQINPALYDKALGDVKGSLVTGDAANGFYSYDSFNQWYNDVAGVNTSKTVNLTLKRTANTNRYVFDSAGDEPYKSRGGFFPINGELYGNYGNNAAGKMSNFHFTTEIDTEFVFEKGKGQVFTFTGDDDVWVFISGKLVIDLGGLHSKSEQTIDLDRLTWLNDGQVYSLKVYHAERRTSESNFRVETSIKLRQVEAPATSGLYD
jgi:fibro-slime domain-containing protein